MSVFCPVARYRVEVQELHSSPADYKDYGSFCSGHDDFRLPDEKDKKICGYIERTSSKEI